MPCLAWSLPKAFYVSAQEATGDDRAVNTDFGDRSGINISDRYRRMGDQEGG
jgi:hypothetical protein